MRRYSRNSHGCASEKSSGTFPFVDLCETITDTIVASFSWSGYRLEPSFDDIRGTLGARSLDGKKEKAKYDYFKHKRTYVVRKDAGIPANVPAKSKFAADTVL